VNATPAVFRRGRSRHHHLVRAIQAEFREIGKIAESGVLE
jgi:hypothetical protein